VRQQFLYKAAANFPAAMSGYIFTLSRMFFMRIEINKEEIIVN
jgi:hypothetical protein